MKMGTQQLIPKGLASDVRLSKTTSPVQQSQGLVGLLGIDHSRRALKALSMVETGSYFSTGAKIGDGADGDCESPGSLRRGLRSTSYRRAVVSGVDSEATPGDLTAPAFPQLHLKVPDGVDGAKLGSPTLTSPKTPKSLSPGTPKLPSPKTLKVSPAKIKVRKNISLTT